jgi:hypothetical protein
MCWSLFATTTAASQHIRATRRDAPSTSRIDTGFLSSSGQRAGSRSDEPGDWNLCRRMLEAEVRIGWCDRVVSRYYPSQLTPRSEPG